MVELDHNQSKFQPEHLPIHFRTPHKKIFLHVNSTLQNAILPSECAPTIASELNKQIQVMKRINNKKKN